MSNEAGQGTLTMSAAVSDARHPCEQGTIQAIGVFLDTIVICTLTGFVLIMGQAWLKPGQPIGLHWDVWKNSCTPAVKSSEKNGVAKKNLHSSVLEGLSSITFRPAENLSQASTHPAASQGLHPQTMPANMLLRHCSQWHTHW